MKIALIYHEFPPVINGIGSYTYDLANNLAKKGIKVVVITGNYNKEDSIEEKKNLKIYRLNTPFIMPKFVWFQLKNKKKVKEILTKEKPDILHGQASSVAFLFSPKIFNGKKVLTMHGNAFQVFKKIIGSPLRYLKFKEALIHIIGFPLWHYLEKNEIKKADLVITFTEAVSRTTKEAYNFKKEIKIIPQGLDFAKIRASSKIREDKSVFFVGRLIWTKGIIYLLKAFKQVVKEIPDLKLKIFGEGPLKNFVLEFIKKNNLEKNILFYGFIPLERLIKETHKSYFCVFPSLFEAESVAMIEAMACGKPIIAFDLPFIKYTLNKNNSLLVKKDTNELAKAIIKLTKNKKLRNKLGKNAYKTVKEKHDWNKIVEDYIKIYESLIKDHTKRK